MDNVTPIFIEVGIIAAVFLGAGLGLVAFAVRQAVRAHHAEDTAARAVAEHHDGWQRSYEQLRDATDSVIVELESHPATYDLFPAQIRELLYSAHDSAGGLGRKNPRR